MGSSATDRDVPRLPRKRRIRIKTHILPFPDHAGNPALIVFRNQDSCPLPPLYAFAMYFTHPDASPDNVDATGLFSAIDHTAEPLDIRLELFFLPGATVEGCVDHYRAETEKRGDYFAQIQALANSDRIPAPGDTEGAEPSTSTSSLRSGLGLPGFVPSYIAHNRTYHGMLYICTTRDWKPDTDADTDTDSGKIKIGIRRVLFDPFSAEEWAEWRDDTEPEVQPAMHVRWVENVDDDWSTPLLGVAQEMHAVSNLQRNNGTTEPWQDAMARRWTRWP